MKNAEKLKNEFIKHLDEKEINYELDGDHIYFWQICKYNHSVFVNCMFVISDDSDQIEICTTILDDVTDYMAALEYCNTLNKNVYLQHYVSARGEEEKEYCICMASVLYCANNTISLDDVIDEIYTHFHITDNNYSQLINIVTKGGQDGE